MNKKVGLIKRYGISKKLIRAIKNKIVLSCTKYMLKRLYTQGYVVSPCGDVEEVILQF